MTNKNEITGLLRAFLQSLEKLSDEEYEQLISGEGRLAFSGPQVRRERTAQSSKLSTEELQEVVVQLQESKSREQAREIIHKDARIALKDNLEQLAKLLKIHVNKYDKRDALEDKVVEAVIGVKLRSAAILGLDFKN